MERTAAGFRALRERVGLSQSDLAEELGVALRSVKRWERGLFDAPDEAWDVLGSYAETQEQMVDHAREIVLSVGEEAGRRPDEIVLTYYRTQEEYDAHGRDEGPYGVANANARAVAAELAHYGVETCFRYPDEGAISTPGSRY